MSDETTPEDEPVADGTDDEGTPEEEAEAQAEAEDED